MAMNVDYPGLLDCCDGSCVFTRVNDPHKALLWFVFHIRCEHPCTHERASAHDECTTFHDHLLFLYLSRGDQRLRMDSTIDDIGPVIARRRRPATDSLSKMG